MRVKIEFPGAIIFTTNLRVRITDINYGNHTGNHALVGLLHEARLQWLMSVGFSELNAGGTSLIMADLAIAFQQESYYGDELTIELYAEMATPKSFNLYYKVFKQSMPEKPVASAKTAMVCFNYDTKKTVPITAALKHVLER
ncbi:MAG TPA: acyl-CoA thioesterase [Ferruginibacter sp.]|nr:acyl-CoA thioesterase [Ferruginibacter sp.]HRO18290.1 acyl-CoA thioesterase [Ferruginibacter sp.]HRQ21600.1 acyl-CoA thioesterase [Ferruginibacter sp.]